MNNEIKRLYFNGFRLQDIADRLCIPLETVKYRIKVMRKNGEIVERWWKREKK